MSKPQNFYGQVNDILLDGEINWDVLKEAVKIKFPLFNIYSADEVKLQIGIENISPDSLFSEETFKEIAREYSFSDIWNEREIKDLIMKYLEDTL